MEFRVNCSSGRIGKLWWTNSMAIPTCSKDLGLEALDAFASRWVLWGRCGWGDGAGWALGSVMSDQ